MEVSEVWGQSRAQGRCRVSDEKKKSPHRGLKTRVCDQKINRLRVLRPLQKASASPICAICETKPPHRPEQLAAHSMLSYWFTL